jgi:hypothetical protein
MLENPSKAAVCCDLWLAVMGGKGGVSIQRLPLCTDPTKLCCGALCCDVLCAAGQLEQCAICVCTTPLTPT